jgi:ABC-type Fe3+ transport system permease subunit
MEFFTIQVVIFAAIAILILAGVIFVIQDARMQRRHEEKYASRKRQSRPASPREHEPA